MRDECLIVLKFGGSVLAGEGHLDEVVSEIHRWRRDGWRVVAVVSALAGTTDRLVRLARGGAGEDADEDTGDGGACGATGGAARGATMPDPHATAALLAGGELESAARLGLRLAEAGLPARVLTPAAIGLRASGPPLDADPVGLDAALVHRSLAETGLVVVPGFVAVDAAGRTVTLGRGGSDLTAVFLAHRLGADRCRLVKDVDGLYERDPSIPARPGTPPPRRYAAATWAAARLTDGSILQHKAIEAARSSGRRFEVAGLQGTSATLVGEPVTRFDPVGDRAAAAAARPPIGVAVLGGGVVGGAVIRLLARRPDRFRIVGVAVRDPQREREWDAVADHVPRTADPLSLAGNVAAAVVIEALGGLEPAHAAVRIALARGATVVTANKALLAVHGGSLASTALATGGRLLGSAAVGGVVPVLERLAAARGRRVRGVRGILNGTSTAVLERLAAGDAFAAAITDARRRGLCESDPARDLDGRDAEDKLRVIAGVLGARPDDVDIVRGAGIGAFGTNSFDGGEIRQVASLTRGTCGDAARTGPGSEPVLASSPRWRGRVALEALAPEDPLAGVMGAGNRVLITWDDGGITVLEGAGAGGRPTAESILGDLLAVWREAGTDRPRVASPVAPCPDTPAGTAAAPVVTSALPSAPEPAPTVAPEPGPGLAVAAALR